MKKIYVIIMSALLMGLSLACWFKGSDEYSQSERRLLAGFPEVSLESITSGKFMSDFESYAQDQFPFRDGFRGIKANAALKLFRQKDNNGLYQAQGHILKQDYPINYDMLDNAANKLTAIYDKYLADTDSKVYLSIIPDKSNYVSLTKGMLTADFDDMEEYMLQKLDFMEYVDIESLLTLDDYYRTDSHWKQDCIGDVAEKIAKAMDGETLSYYEHKLLSNPFYGVYAGQLAVDTEPDRISYVSNAMIDNCIVTSYDSGKPETVPFYDFEAAEGRDPYEFFLNGADALLEIENPNAKTDRELIIFRDSFGSSLAPLLLETYSKITLVDTRYVQSGLLGSFIEFDGQDVLFIYSTGLLNNSLALK